MDRLFLNLPFTLSELLTALAIVVAFILAGKTLTWLGRKYLDKWAKKTKTQLDDLLVEKVKPPLSYIIWFLALKLVLGPLHLNYEALDRAVNTIILFITAWLVAAILDIFIKYYAQQFTARTKSEMDDALLPLVDKTIKIVVWVIALIWALAIWSVDIGPILGGLGIAGLALGFAVKDSLANIFGGVSLILDRAIKVGDKVKLESGEMGHIIDVGLRSTRLRTFNNEIITIPNGQMVNSRIQNFGQPDPSLRIVIDFGVDYKSDVDRVKMVVSEIIKSMEEVMSDPPAEVLFLSMEDFYLKFSARFWVADHELAWGKKLEATDKIFKVLKDNKIEIPYPVQTIHVKK